MTGERTGSSVGVRLRRVMTSGPVLTVGIVLLAVAMGIATAWLHVLRPPPPPSATSAFIQMLGGDTNPF